MTFDTKITSFFAKFTLELGTPPTRNLTYLYADYVELVSLISKQNYISSTDILDRLKDEGIIKQKLSDADQSEANDEDESFIDDVFRLILERSQLFEDDYPFEIEGVNKIKLKNNDIISDRNKIYLYLLTASSLNIFYELQSDLTTEFENLCKEVLINFLPKHAIVKSFGKNTSYRGTAVEKIKALANDMRVTIDNDAFDEISVKGTQEKGLDLVGWIPFNDNVPNVLSVLAQCACGKEWYKKLGETSRYNNYFKFHRLNPVHTIFIPYNLVSFNKNIFFKNDEIDNRLLFERKRIMNYIISTDFFSTYNSKTLVDYCLSFEEDIV